MELDNQSKRDAELIVLKVKEERLAVDNECSWFSIVKPIEEDDKYWSRKVSQHKKLTMTNQRWVYDSGPYYYYITLTFSVKLSLEACCLYVNRVLDRMSEWFFTRNYREKSYYMQGFAFFEEHPQGSSINDEHVHMLIKFTDVYRTKTLKVVRKKFKKICKNIFDDKSRHVFNKKGIKFKLADFQCRNDYSFKRITDSELWRIKTIGVGGLSDNLGKQKYFGYSF